LATAHAVAAPLNAAASSASAGLIINAVVHNRTTSIVWRGTESLLTHRWRGMDSNHRSFTGRLAVARPGNVVARTSRPSRRDSRFERFRVRTRLFAGGRWIRTFSSAPDGQRFRGLVRDRPAPVRRSGYFRAFANSRRRNRFAAQAGRKLGGLCANGTIRIVRVPASSAACGYK
jgi:hypothetical protein